LTRITGMMGIDTPTGSTGTPQDLRTVRPRGHVRDAEAQAGPCTPNGILKAPLVPKCAGCPHQLDG
jgi:hypothetical protein